MASAAKTMIAARRRFVVLALLPGRFGSIGGKADFSTALRCGRNDDFVCGVRFMVEGSRTPGGASRKSKDKSKDKDKSKCGGSSLRSE
jgi:hypothetical protein